ncbi:MAG TPA: ATP-binding cassette domain-containing protein [Mycobacteriales bacterium]|nr:ATP-binding cassette domain-containing protein [Mycobacteriales bacterium]
MTRLDVQGLTVEYRSAGYPVRPLDGLDMTAETGELVLLLGPSGCGKTTLLSVLAGILTPTSGTVLLDGTPVTGLRGGDLTSYRRSTVGVVFQAFNLVPSLSAVENVAAPLWAAGVGRRPARERATALLTQVGLADRLRHRPGDLSGGQQQRVAIARALVHDPPLLLADEPTAHLDHVQVEVVLRTLRTLAAPGRLVVVATHDDRMVPLADRVVQMRPDLADGPDAPERLAFEEGELIFAQGERGTQVYVIAEGEVLLTRAGERGEEVLARLGPGEYFGELGPMLGFPRSATARATRASVLVGYGVADFKALLRDGKLAARSTAVARRRTRPPAASSAR